MKKRYDYFLDADFNNDFDNYGDKIVGSIFTREFYDANEDWLNEGNGIFDVWLNKLYNKRYTEEEAASIIERARRFYYRRIN